MPAKSKKVAVFVDGEFIPSFSGASNRFHYLSRALEEYTDTEVVVILCDRGWSDVKQIERENFKTYVVHPGLFKNIDFLTEILENESIDIIQFANLELAIEIGIPLSNRLSKPLVFEAHYGDFEFAKTVGASQKALKAILFLQNTFGKSFDKVIALSGEDFELSRNLKIKQSGVSAIPSGVNLAEFPDNCFNGHSKRIIFLGNLFFDVNLKAVKEIKRIMYGALKKFGYTFLIIGDISSREKRKLEDKGFSFTGKSADLFESFKNTSVALAPVLGGSGIRIKILNYLNAGIPVITTSQGARGFDRKDLLIIEDDLSKYPALIQKLIDERKTLSRLSELGRKFVRANMSWEVIAKSVSKEYDGILKKPALSKRRAVDKILKLQFEDPAWVKEVIREKRFKRNVPFIGADQYITVGSKGKRVIALEGLPCSGKSVFMDRFKRNNADYFCIPELYIDVKKNDSSAATRERYASAEILKKKNVDRAAGHNFMLDRSFISTLAFSYAKYKTTGDADDYLFNKRFLRDNRQNIVIPDYVFVFRITPAESIRRRKKLVRDDTLDFWKNEIFLQNFSDFYASKDCMNIVGNEDRIVFVDTMKMGKEKTYRFISDRIKGLDKRTLNKSNTYCSWKR